MAIPESFKSADTEIKFPLAKSSKVTVLTSVKLTSTSTFGKVVGDVYLIDPIIFDKLDEFEGEEYIRIKTKTSTDVECWVY